MISEKSFLSGYLHHDRYLHSKFHVSSSSSLGSAMIVSQSVSPFIYILADAPCFATVNLNLLRKVKALNFSFLFHYYGNSDQVLYYVYTNICPRRRLHQMCLLKKDKKINIIIVIKDQPPNLLRSLISPNKLIEGGAECKGNKCHYCN